MKDGYTKKEIFLGTLKGLLIPMVISGFRDGYKGQTDEEYDEEDDVITRCGKVKKMIFILAGIIHGIEAIFLIIDNGFNPYILLIPGAELMMPMVYKISKETGFTVGGIVFFYRYLKEWKKEKELEKINEYNNEIKKLNDLDNKHVYHKIVTKTPSTTETKIELLKTKKELLEKKKKGITLKLKK